MPIPRDELEGRRAVHWHWYVYSGTYTPNQALRSRGGSPQWNVRISRPTRRYAISTGKPGAKVRKIHVVRDQLIATHRTKPEVRCTRYLCGAYSFSAELLRETNIVCSQCHLKDSGQQKGNVDVG